MKVKLTDIARRAGVGHATVDRVLNERGGVKPDTAKRVLDAARELGLARTLPKLYRNGLRLEVLLGRRDNPLCARINDAFRRFIHLMDDNIVLERTFVDETKPDLVAAAIRNSRCNAIIVYGQEHEMIIEAIAEVTSIGKPVITLVSDVPTAPRLNYVGINHYNAGRAAAFFLSKMTNEGRVVLLCGSLHYRAHAERISGFRDGIADYSGRLAIVDLIEARGDDAAAEYMLCKALTEGEVAGIYNAGASDAAVERAISTMNRQLAPVLVGHDLTENAARMLQNGVMAVVIDQNPDLQAQKALRILAARFGISNEAQESPIVPFTIHVKDNI
ncbi:substrate-binding domain-containing protein [Sinorhizobium medicae]|nr:substrate-binding domain-containing protein [Sinorhizobium medicae]